MGWARVPVGTDRWTHLDKSPSYPMPGISRPDELRTKIAAVETLSRLGLIAYLQNVSTATILRDVARRLLRVPVCARVSRSGGPARN